MTTTDENSVRNKFDILKNRAEGILGDDIKKQIWWNRAEGILGDDIKKQIWCELQLLRETTSYETEITSEETDNLEKKLSLQHKKVGITVGGLIRIVGMLMGLILIFPILIILAPLRIFHPLLNRLGVTNNYLPLEWVQTFLAHFLLCLSCIQVKSEGKENLSEFVKKGKPVLGFFQHLSNLDSFTIASQSPISFKWIAKKSIFRVPLFGQLVRVYDVMVGLDRSNREDSIARLNSTGELVRSKGRSIAISPEGTRSTTGQLTEFKKGAFHLALACKVPIIIIMMYGQYELWPPGQKLPSPGAVSLKFLSPIENYDNLNYNQLLKEVRKVMLKATTDKPKYPPSFTVSKEYLLLHYTMLLTTYTIFIYVVLYIYKLF